MQVSEPPQMEQKPLVSEVASKQKSMLGMKVSSEERVTGKKKRDGER